MLKNTSKFKLKYIIFLLAFMSILILAFLFKINTNKKTIVIEKITKENKLEKPVYFNNNIFLFPDLDIEIKTKEAPPKYLKGGETHDIVYDLQEKLMELGFMENDEPTNYYGPVTLAAVKVFQRQLKIAQDGIVGPETLEKILSDDAPHYFAKLNDSGDDIKRIQKRLYSLGYLALASQVNGTFDEKTREAVIHFQSLNNIQPTDGLVGIKTTDILYSDDVKSNISVFGEKSEIVEVAQNKLFSLGYLTSTPDGTYGNDTLEAIKRFQSQHNIIVDGYLGPETREILNSNKARPNSLDLGDNGVQVANIQKRLNKLGYLRNREIDSYYGETTLAAVKFFQKTNSLVEDGRVGPNTIKLLNSSSAKKAPARRNPNLALAKNNTKNKKKNQNNNAAQNIPAADSSSVNALLQLANSKVGTPYVWGAKGPNSFDCSGFVHWCLNNSGVNQSYLTSSGWRNAGRYTRISNFSDIRAGDIVVVKGHVGIATGNGGVIDASSSNGGVVRRSLSSWWQRNFKVAWRIF